MSSFLINPILQGDQTGVQYSNRGRTSVGLVKALTNMEGPLDVSFWVLKLP